MIASSSFVQQPSTSLLQRFADFLFYPHPVTLMIEIVLAILILATVIVILLPRFTSRAPMAELRARVKSWWIMVVLTVLAIAIDQRISLVFFAVLSFLSLKEFFTLVHLRIVDRRAILLAYLAIPIQYWWIHIEWYDLFLIFVPVYMFLIIPFRLVIAGETQRFMTSAGKLHWGLMAFVFGLSHLSYLLKMNLATPFEAGSRGLLIYVVFLAEFNDVLQYLFGKTLGRHKMTPTISPNKTWEGFLGGLVCTSALAVVLRFLTPMDWLHALAAGFLIATIGPIGGMIISAIKRDVGVKDSGALIPGHGGILDRIDSLCFSVPIFFHFIAYFYW
ncbi:MAG: phosphatidate cytidylyltransferase [Phycisphaerales bacterium]|nr:phosphatidate cytidylyltransferase [Phycisphaerales bacterium]